MKQIIKRPSVFAKEILNIEPFDYNVPFLDDMGYRLIYRTGRQVGKSTMVSILGLHTAWLLPYVRQHNNRRGRVSIISARLEQSTELLENVGAVLAGAPLMHPYIIRQNRTRIDIKWLGYPHQYTTISALAAGGKGKSARSYTSNVIILDECRDMPDSVYYAAVPGGIAADCALYLTSTPSENPIGFFYEKCMDSVLVTKPGNDERLSVPAVHGADPDSDWRQFNAITLDNPLITKRQLKEYDKWPKEEYQREVLGIFTMAGGLMFNRDDLNKCLRVYDGPKKGAYYYLGVDVAVGGDDTVYCVVGKYGNKVWIELLEGRSTSTIIEVANRVKQIARQFTLTDISIDSTGLGIGVVNLLDADGVTTRPIHFTAQQKLSMYSNLATLIELPDVMYLGSDESEAPVLVNQLSGISVEKSETGTKKIKAKYADDYPDATALACWEARFSNDIDFWRDNKGNPQTLDAVFG